MDSSFDLLVERGFVHQASNGAALREALRRPITLYCGYDATASSLHVGSLVTIMLMAHLQRAGHRPIGLVGGGTTLVGDPSGKTEARPLLSREQIRENMRGIRAQLGRYLDFEGGRALMLDNADWLLELKYVEFLREIGRHFSVNQLLQHETYRERLQGSGLSFIELNYALLQAYDFLHLYREYDCRLQVGGSDQWFNILAGTELIRRVAGGEAFALVTPLIATASGAKMGKTAAGAVWLNPDLLSPYDYWQFWRNTEDGDVGRFLRLFTLLPMAEIARLEALAGAEINEAKKVLATEATALLHGREAAAEAEETARKTFEQGELAESLPTVEVPGAVLEAGLGVLTAFGPDYAGLVPSTSEARRQIKGGGLKVNDRTVTDERAVLRPRDLTPEGVIKLSFGKKKHVLLRAV